MKLTEQQLKEMGYAENKVGEWQRLGPSLSVCQAPPDRRQQAMNEPPKPPKRIRQSSKPLMNKLESEFKEYYENYSGHTLIPQALRFRLGNGIWFKVDFVAFSQNGNWAFEIKGPHAFRGGFENLKVAASLYPQFVWMLWWKDGNQWKHQTVLQ